MKKILVAPLDWGLGHATRCIPIIRELLKRNCEVYLAGSGDSMKLLREEFPSLPYSLLPGYDPVYPDNGSMVWKMVLQVPKFIKVIKEEHRCIEEVIERNGIDILISDNRYGCWSAKIPSVFITHQTNIRMPNGLKWLSPVMRTFNSHLMRNFTVCWIPDVPGENSIAGDLILVDDPSLPIKYIGLLSRFGKKEGTQTGKYDVLCIFSGPEPQRSNLEKIVSKEVAESGLRYLIVRGIIDDVKHSRPAGSNQVDYLDSDNLQQVIEQSSCIISRSGYSTLMDLATLGKKAIFIPTPGQTEQEYLADRLMKAGIAYSTTQATFNLKMALQKSKGFRGFQLMDTRDLLKEAVNEILDSPAVLINKKN